MRTYLDKRVYWSLAGVFFIGLVILLYNFFNPEVLTPVFYFPDKAYEGELVKFCDSTADADSWEWDFGDSTPPSYLQNPIHRYKSIDEFLVTLTVNEKFRASKRISILSKPIEDNIAYDKNEPNIPDIFSQKEKNNIKKSSGHVKDKYDSKEKKDNRQTIFDSKKKIVKAEADPYEEFLLCPIKTHGDDYFRKPVKVWGSVELKISDDQKRIYAVVFAYFIEEGGNKQTKAAIDGNLLKNRISLYSAPASKKIERYFANNKESFSFPPTVSKDVLTARFKGFVNQIKVVANTGTRDLPCDKTPDKCLFRISFNDFDIELSDDKQ